ncbi:enoyl-CoA hydratase [Hellea balneolensis]|uniref:enoyl-CoA hydratase n=1 Tax=Hellea balneolensis TaxID=287478 RepID=UPI000413E55A|nr:enoyl-CoA hydratase [Hellea balneolensis]
MEINSDILLTGLENGILRLTLNDSSRRNALSKSLLQKLLAELKGAHDNKAIKVVLITANGPVFSAGHDLKEITIARKSEDGGLAFFQELMNLCASVMQAIVKNSKPVIAQIDGVATAAGCQLIASCDLAYASRTSRFATPGVNIGLFCSTPMVALSRNVTHKHAMEMLLTGDMISAGHAQNIGLLNRVVESDDLALTTSEIAKKIMSKSSAVLSIGKGAFYTQTEMPLAQAYEYCSNVMVENMMNEHAQEGVSAFLEKRPANWGGGHLIRV